MSDLKACPFCGGEASIENDGLYRWVECLNSKCEASARVFMFINDVGNADYIVAQNWNTRPLEDAANARAEAAEARAERLQAALADIAHGPVGTWNEPQHAAEVIKHMMRVASDALKGGEE